MEIEDNRWIIAKVYVKGWFFIDLMAVLPFEFIIKMFIGRDASNSDVDYNKFIRMSRMSKIYKLIKITRLIRLLKLMKKSNKGAVNKLGQKLKISQGLEKLAFFFLALMLMSHFVGCLWIFVARNFHDESDL